MLHFAAARPLPPERPQLIRLPDSGAEAFTTGACDWCLRIRWIMRSPLPDGLPTADEQAELDAVERMLVASLKHAAVLSVVTLHNGVAEWLFYTANPRATTRRVTALPRPRQAVPLLVESFPDPAWQLYQEAGAQVH